MIGLWLALLLAVPGVPPSDALGARLAASTQAAEALQGPLDGRWILRDAGGRTILALQFIDPADGGPLQAAWAAVDGGALGVVDDIARMRGRVRLRFRRRPGAEASELRLRRDGDGLWRGRMAEGGAAKTVTMRRDAPR